ncbi:hypothetical protein C8J57DRAFT_1249705 [Mycena rebaudengoi]|nr:hypothetical protein C8J57DRAFT_1249705 [Mycena rebaudengoi]
MAFYKHQAGSSSTAIIIALLDIWRWRDGCSCNVPLRYNLNPNIFVRGKYRMKGLRNQGQLGEVEFISALEAAGFKFGWYILATYSQTYVPFFLFALPQEVSTTGTLVNTRDEEKDTIQQEKNPETSHTLPACSHRPLREVGSVSGGYIGAVELPHALCTPQRIQWTIHDASTLHIPLTHPTNTHQGAVTLISPHQVSSPDSPLAHGNYLGHKEVDDHEIRKVEVRKPLCLDKIWSKKGNNRDASQRLNCPTQLLQHTCKNAQFVNSPEVRKYITNIIPGATRAQSDDHITLRVCSDHSGNQESGPEPESVRHVLPTHMDKPKSGHNGLGYRPNASITVDTHPPYLLWADISPKANAQWVLTDVINMAEFLVPHVSADGNKYKAPVIRSLTDYLND